MGKPPSELDQATSHNSCFCETNQTQRHNLRPQPKDRMCSEGSSCGEAASGRALQLLAEVGEEARPRGRVGGCAHARLAVTPTAGRATVGVPPNTRVLVCVRARVVDSATGLAWFSADLGLHACNCLSAKARTCMLASGCTALPVTLHCAACHPAALRQPCAFKGTDCPGRDHCPGPPNRSQGKGMPPLFLLTALATAC
jgi:hypothetical protein